ncbi:MAG: hypothetical protein PHC99_08100 [Methylococcales bacterium]|nr:hypothetical protein [Methylococcales bacterium]
MALPVSTYFDSPLNVSFYQYGTSSPVAYKISLSAPQLFKFGDPLEGRLISLFNDEGTLLFSYSGSFNSSPSFPLDKGSYYYVMAGSVTSDAQPTILTAPIGGSFPSISYGSSAKPWTSAIKNFELPPSLDSLIADKAALQTSVATLTNEKATALAEKTAAVTARDTALSEKATALADLTTVTAARDTALAEKATALADLTTVTAARDTALSDLALTEAYAHQKDEYLSSALGELVVLRANVGVDSVSQFQIDAKTALDSAISAFNSISTPSEVLAIDADKKQIASDLANITFNSADNLKLTADVRDNFIVGNAGNNVITGGDGSDTINGGAGDDVISGGNGNDLIVSFSGRNKLSGDAGDDSIVGSVNEDNIDGGIGNDTILGGGGHDYIKGGKGDDSIIGSTLNDTIDGGDGNDFINAGDGVNKLSGGKGDDIINSGKHDDLIDGGDDNDTINAGDGKNDVKGGKGNDSITTGKGNDKIDAGDGNDIVNGGLGDNNIKGGKGDDSITAKSGIDSIDGGDGNDTIDGGAGDDVLVGGKGNDVIKAGTGKDVISGGADADTFVLSLQGFSTIKDFKSVELDKLVFTDSSTPVALDAANFVTAVTSDFTFTNESPAFAYNSKTGALFYDADGSGLDSQTVQIALIANKPLLVASDILI